MTDTWKVLYRAIPGGLFLYVLPFILDPVLYTDSAAQISRIIMQPLGIDVIGAGIAVVLLFNIKKIHYDFEHRARYEWRPLRVTVLTFLGLLLIVCGFLFSDFTRELIIGIGRQLLGGLFVAVLAIDLDI